MAQNSWATEWKALLGAEHVITDAFELDAASTATFPTSVRVLGIIRPGNRSEVQQCLRTANKLRRPIYPISRGRNWGLGSRVPLHDGTILLDLSRMDRILEFSESLAFIQVEPGVSFRQVHEFLRDRNSNLMLPMTGGPSDGSLIGNLAERGEAVGPYGDRAAFACGLEIVLPTGDCVQTGFRRFGETETAHVDPRGVGPQLDGLFLQSNLGVLTSATFWLMPKPANMDVFTFTVGQTFRLGSLIEALRGALLRGIISDHCLSLWNGYKIFARSQEAITPDELDHWFGSGVLYTESKEQASANIALVKRTLAGVVQQLRFLDGESEYAVRDSIFAGKPSDANIRSTYWRSQGELRLPMDPDRDHCGFIWICASIPMEGANVVRAIKIIEETMINFCFEPNIGMSCASGRLLHAFAAIVFDRSEPGQDERAMACHVALSRALSTAGYFPYRLGINGMDCLPQSADDYGALLATMKRALDPNNILASGRYDFGESSSSDSDVGRESSHNRQNQTSASEAKKAG